MKCVEVDLIRRYGLGLNKTGYTTRRKKVACLYISSTVLCDLFVCVAVESIKLAAKVGGNRGRGRSGPLTGYIGECSIKRSYDSMSIPNWFRQRSNAPRNKG